MLDDSPVNILIKTLEKLSKLGNGDRLGNSDGNVIAQKGLASYYEALGDINTVKDGYGNIWDKKCSVCNENSVHVIKPGQAECLNCN